MSNTLLSVEHLTKRFGGLVVTNDLTLAVLRKETHALIGPNGAGKSTLIGQLFGQLFPDKGRILFADKDVTHWPAHRRARAGMSRSFQVTSVFPEFSALANVVMAVQAKAGHCFRFFRRALTDPSLLISAGEALRLVGLRDRGEALASELSHGERRQLELAMAIASRPQLLLLDEPMAGMARADGLAMMAILRNLKPYYAILLVEHDMDVVFSLADRISVLVAGRIIATGEPDAIRRNTAVKLAYLGHH
jgi:branched-chain amino acid transport system ATP-binding protein